MLKLDDILGRLPPFPEFFTDRHKAMAQSLGEVLLRDRMLDEAVWLQIQRYAVHRIKWDDINLDLETDDAEDEKGFGSAKVQRLAYLDKVLTPLERELFVTPASRKESLGTEQSSFMDLLTDGAKAVVDPAVSEPGGVTPFRPRRRAVGG